MKVLWYFKVQDTLHVKFGQDEAGTAAAWIVNKINCLDLKKKEELQ